MKTLKTNLMLLIFELILVQIQAKEVVVNSREDLTAIINHAKGGDTILVKPGTYAQVSLSDRNFSEQKPLIVRAESSGTVIIEVNVTETDSGKNPHTPQKWYTNF